MRVPLLCVAALIVFAARPLAAQNPTPSCSDTWGNPDQRTNLNRAMYTGSISDVQTATANAENSRTANHVGCPNVNVYYTTYSTTPPSFSTVANIWTSNHDPGIRGYTTGCAPLPHDWASAALAAFYAQIAGYSVTSAMQTAQANILGDFLSTQYVSGNASIAAGTVAGSFGQLSVPSGNSCYNSNTTGGVNTWCNAEGFSCVTYTGGTFSGQTFRTMDIDAPNSNWDGGLQYDQGWAVTAMVEGAIQAPTASARASYLSSAQSGASWAANEQPVNDYNYTAKSVWLDAELYDLTGTTSYYNDMMDKLNRGILPPILMDQDNDGYVDGMSNQPFSALWVVAGEPGRYWDGHNSRGVYMAMNGLALVEAYVALRDRGNSSDAANVKPYMLAVLNNLADEIGNHGVSNSGQQNILQTLAMGLWKVDAVEGLGKSNWASAAAAEWNTGANANFNNSSVTAGIGYNSMQVASYLVYLSGVPYTPLNYRDVPDTVFNLNITDSGATPMGNSEVAGALPRQNWNNLSGSSGSGQSLVDSNGTPSSVTASWSAAGTVDNANIPDNAGDDRMMRTYLNNGNTSSTSVTVSGLPSHSAGYTVYVYTAGSFGSATVTSKFTIGSTNISCTEPANSTFNGTYTQCSNSNGNYVVFNSVSGTSFTVSGVGTYSSNGKLRAPINGIQVVAN